MFMVYIQIETASVYQIKCFHCLISRILFCSTSQMSYLFSTPDEHFTKQNYSLFNKKGEF